MGGPDQDIGIVTVSAAPQGRIGGRTLDVQEVHAMLIGQHLGDAVGKVDPGRRRDDCVGS